MLAGVTTSPIFPITKNLPVLDFTVLVKTALKIIGAKDDAKYLPIELRIQIPIEDKDISKI